MTQTNDTKFIVLETTDGGGKDTQAKAIIKFLESIGIKATFQHNPTDPETSIGSIIRSVLQGKTECSLYELQRLFTLDRDIQTEKIKELLKDSWVICARHKYSTIAYGMATRKIHPENMSEEQLAKLIELNSQFLHADLTIILDVPAEISMQRIDNRGEEKELFDKIDFQRAVRESYLELHKQDSTTVLVSNGTIEEVSNRIFDIIKNKYLS